MSKEIMYERIYKDLLTKIMKQEYLPGDKLPTEKELTDEYHVSRITAKKAMDMLAYKEFIKRIPGRGSYVNKSSARIKEDVLAEDKTAQEIMEHNSGKKRVIHVIFDMFGADFGVELLRGIEAACRKLKLSMMFSCTYADMDVEKDLIIEAQEHEVSGIILMCVQNEMYSNIVLQMVLDGFPLLLVDRHMIGLSVSCVKTDNYTAAQELAAVLVERGHKRICFLTHKDINTTTIQERYNGFCEYLLEHEGVSSVFAKLKNYNKVVDDKGSICEGYDYTELEQIVENTKQCSAYLTTEYQIAVLLGQVLKSKQMESEIVTFDGVESIIDAQYVSAQIKQDEYEIGRTAVRLLYDIINGKSVTGHINIPHKLIVH